MASEVDARLGPAVHYGMMLLSPSRIVASDQAKMCADQQVKLIPFLKRPLASRRGSPCSPASSEGRTTPTRIGYWQAPARLRRTWDGA
jgi:hypothetical protein